MHTEILKVDASSIHFEQPGAASSRLTISDPATEASLHRAVKILQTTAQPVAFPTETVYGLGASALDDAASRAIYTAKRRPADNPLIVHVSGLDQLQRVLHTELPAIYEPLVAHFWPGPLTVVLPAPHDPNTGSSVVSPVCTHGQDTVAVRMPAHPVARALIALSDLPLAAPSANASTRPSPTTAQHVYADLQGRLPLIIDGGACDVGVESTVVDGTVSPPRLLRPGGITLEQIRDAGGPAWANVVVGKATAGKDEIVRTPGMKYKHYSPKAPVVLFNGCGNGVSAVTKYLQSHLPSITSNSSSSDSNNDNINKPKIALLSTREFDTTEIEAAINAAGSLAITKTLGKSGAEISHNLFSALREMDEDQGCDMILVEGIDEANEGLAVMNRLTKAASIVITS
jgi:L-threonylcarbamoyladenylate synthase